MSWFEHFLLWLFVPWILGHDEHEKEPDDE